MCAIIGFDSPTLTEQEIRPYFDRTVSRGPDMSRMEKAGRGMLGFHRLAIMGLHEEGMQPFHLGGDMAVCNGELYGFRPVKAELEAEGTIHLALVYRGDRENADKFLTSQDEIILELYPPEPDPEEKPQENPAESEPAADSSETAETEAPAKTEEVA